MKILVIGNIAVNYRSEYLLNFLIKNNYKFQWIDKDYFLMPAQNTLLLKILRRIANPILKFIYFFIECLYIIKSDCIYILPMNHDSITRYYFAKLLRKKVITDFYVSLYDTYINDRKKYSKKSLTAYKLKYLDRQAFYKSDKVIFLNRSEYEYYSEIIDCNLENNGKKIIIPLFVPQYNKAKLPYLNNIREIPTICWWGTFLNLHGLDNIIKAFCILLQRNFKANFYLFGIDNDQSKKYIKILEEKELTKKIFLRTDLTFANGLIEFLIENCDLALGNFGENEKARNVLINKILDACSMYIPVLTMQNNAVVEFFNDNSIFISNNNPEEIANKIETVLLNKERCKVVALNGNNIYRSVFTQEKYFQKLHNLFSSLNWKH